MLTSRLAGLKKAKQSAESSKAEYRARLDIMYGGEVDETASFAEIAAAIREIPLDTYDLFEQKLKDRFPWVAKTIVVWVPRGIGTSDFYFSVWPDPEAETPSCIPTAEQLTEVQNWLTYPCTRENLQNDIRVNIKCIAPNTANVNITVFIKPAEGYTFNQAQSASEAALRGFFSPMRLSQGASLAKLGNLLYELPEVANYKFALPASDLAARSTVLPILGNLTIRELGG